MDKKYMPWLIGAVVVIAIGFALTTRTPAPAPTTSAPDTTNTKPAGTTPAPISGAKPIATIVGFASVSATSAVVIGAVNPKGAKTSYWFEYGPTISFGSSTSIASLPAGSTAQSATANLTGLKPSTSYYFRVGAKNAYGVSYSGLQSFITSPAN